MQGLDYLHIQIGLLHPSGVPVSTEAIQIAEDTEAPLINQQFSTASSRSESVVGCPWAGKETENPTQLTFGEAYRQVEHPFNPI